MVMADAIESAAGSAEVLAGVRVPTIPLLLELEDRRGSEAIGGQGDGPGICNRLWSAFVDAERKVDRFWTAKAAAEHASESVRQARELRDEIRTRLVAEAAAERERESPASGVGPMEGNKAPARALDKQIERLDEEARHEASALRYTYYALHSAEGLARSAQATLVSALKASAIVEFDLQIKKFEDERKLAFRNMENALAEPEARARDRASDSNPDPDPDE